MNLKKYFLLFSFTSFLITYGQSGDFNCWIQTQPNQNQAKVLSKTSTLVQGNVKIAVILCVEQGQNKIVIR